MNQKDIKNVQLKNYPFLQSMYENPFFPEFLVDKGRDILIDLCLEIELKQPANLSELYKISTAATNKFNRLGREFMENGSLLEAGAREAIATDFDSIARIYGYEASVELMIEAREW